MTDEGIYLTLLLGLFSINGYNVLAQQFAMGVKWAWGTYLISKINVSNLKVHQMLCMFTVDVGELRVSTVPWFIFRCENLLPPEQQRKG